MIHIDHISKHYDHRKILDHVCFSINREETLAIVGHNGSGKSTLLKSIAGLEKPTAGRIVKKPAEMKIGYVPEQFPNNIRFSPNEYLTLLGEMEGQPLPSLKKKITDLLHTFRLSDYADIRIQHFSKGMKQKIGIMQALLSKPDFLILNEPLSGLDPQSQEELADILNKLKYEGLPILFTCHERKLLERVADRVYRINQGKIIAENVFPRVLTMEIKAVLSTDLPHPELHLETISKSFRIRDCELVIKTTEEQSNQVIVKLITNSYKIRSVNPSYS